MAAQLPNPKTLIAPLVTTAAVLGIIQGLIWLLLSVLSVLIHNNAIEVYVSELPEYGLTIGQTIFEIYLDASDNGHSLSDESIIILSENFSIFMYLYIPLSFGLLVCSSIILWASLTQKSEKHYLYRIGAWTVIVAVSSVLDLILMGLIAHDYVKAIEIFEKLSQQWTSVETVILTSVGIVMTLAARGFVIWVINVIFAGILGKHCYDLYTKGPQADPTVIDAFASGPAPPWGLPNSIDDETTNSNYDFTNKSFKDDNSEPLYSSSSHSFSRLPINEQINRNPGANPNFGNRLSPNYGYNGDNFNNNVPNKGSQNGLDNSQFMFAPERNNRDTPNQWGGAPLRTAKIGRQGGQRSPPLHVPSPHIPDPDYSPPGSLRVKSALRPRSNYQL